VIKSLPLSPNVGLSRWRFKCLTRCSGPLPSSALRSSPKLKMMYWFICLETRKYWNKWRNTRGFRSYAECCIDDVTASHAQRNDLIVKFGHSCLTTKES